MGRVGRRQFLVVTGALFAAPFAAEAQQLQKIRRIGVLPPGPLSVRLHLWDAFRQGLRELGYVEGQTIAIVFPSAEVSAERLPELAQELVRLKVDVIVAAGTVAIQAAQNATKTIPIVMPVVTDPVGTGAAASLARPGGNVTGLTLISPDITGKRVQLLKEIVPGASRIVILSNPTSRNSEPQIREAEIAARALGAQLAPLQVRGPDDFESAFQTASKHRADALLAVDDALFFTHRKQIVDLAAKHRLPALYGYREFVDAGGLMTYAANLPEMYRRAAHFVDKILKGAKPADLPIEQPTTFELVINMKTAKALGIAIPPSVLLRADRVIE